MINVAALIFSMVGAAFTAYISKGKKLPYINTGPGGTPETLTFHQRIQLKINLLLKDSGWIYQLMHLKYGGPSGMPVNYYTARVCTIHKALEALGELPIRGTGPDDFPLWLNDVVGVGGTSIDDYDFSPIHALKPLDNLLSNGFKRDFNWHTVFQQAVEIGEKIFGGG